jgi:hypothetical protein
MSCCRGKPTIRGARTANQHPDCAQLENSGALLMLYPMATDKGMKLVVKTPRSGLVEISSFAGALNCGGATASLLKRYAAQLSQLATDAPTKFAMYVGKGIQLGSAITLIK